MKQSQTPQPTPVELTPSTRQYYAEGFRVYAHNITLDLNRFTIDGPFHPDTNPSYLRYWQAVGNWQNLAYDHLADCPELSELPDYHPYDGLAGLAKLLKYCQDAARRLLGKTDTSPELSEKFVPWNDSDPDFMAVKETVTEWNGKKIGPGRVLKLTDDRLRRFVIKYGVTCMTKGKRRKVNTCEFADAIGKHGQELAETEATPEFVKAVSAQLAQTWECLNCENEIPSVIRPELCPRCGRSAMTRKTMPSQQS